MTDSNFKIFVFCIEIWRMHITALDCSHEFTLLFIYFCHFQIGIPWNVGQAWNEVDMDIRKAVRLEVMRNLFSRRNSISLGPEDMSPKQGLHGSVLFSMSARVDWPTEKGKRPIGALDRASPKITLLRCAIVSFHNNPWHRCNSLHRT